MAKAEQLAKQAQVKVTNARIASAAADLEAAHPTGLHPGQGRLARRQRAARGGRALCRRGRDAGGQCAAAAHRGADPITAVFFVTERDYARRTRQSVSLSTDAFPDESFAGEIQRIAPVFQSQRARRASSCKSPTQTCAPPGMFVRATVTLEQVEQAVIVPQQALTSRDGRAGCSWSGRTTPAWVWRVVEPGILQGDRLQLDVADLDGRVVVLGQQLLDDGAPIRITPDKVTAKP